MDEILGHLREAMAILTVPDGESLPFEQVKEAYAELVEAEKAYKTEPLMEYMSKSQEYLQKSWEYSKLAQLVRSLMDAKRLSEEVALQTAEIRFPVFVGDEKINEFVVKQGGRTWKEQ